MQTLQCRMLASFKSSKQCSLCNAECRFEEKLMHGNARGGGGGRRAFQADLTHHLSPRQIALINIITVVNIFSITFRKWQLGNNRKQIFPRHKTEKGLTAVQGGTIGDNRPQPILKPFFKPFLNCSSFPHTCSCGRISSGAAAFSGPQCLLPSLCRGGPAEG